MLRIGKLHDDGHVPCNNTHYNIPPAKEFFLHCGGVDMPGSIFMEENMDKMF